MAKFLRSLLPAFLAGVAAGAFGYLVGRVVEHVDILALNPYVCAVLGFSCASGIYICESMSK